MASLHSNILGFWMSSSRWGALQTFIDEQISEDVKKELFIVFFVDRKGSKTGQKMKMFGRSLEKASSK